MAALLTAIALFVMSGLLFRAALPRDGKARWFIGTVWEAYIVVALVTALAVSLGFLGWATFNLL